jgi:ribosome biogenesis protein SSF1/2
MPKKRVKKRTHVKKSENPGDPKTPKSFVIRTGKTTADPLSSSLSQLVLDVRKIMEPNTARRLRERRANKLKDYLTMAGPLGVTHMLLFSRTEQGTNLRIARTPHGPTLHFKIHSYSLCKDVKRHQKAPKESVNDFLNPPLVC